MRPIHLADVGKTRPVLVLTREIVRGSRTEVTVAPITSTVRGLVSELHVDHRNGIEHASVVNLDSIRTIRAADLRQQIGFLLEWQEPLLAEAIRAAFDLR